MDNWLTRRFCEGRLSALQSAGGAAAAVLSSAQDDRVVAVAQGASHCSQNAQRSMLRRALRGSRLPVLYWANVPLWGPLDARCVSTVPFLLIYELVMQLTTRLATGSVGLTAEKSWHSADFLLRYHVDFLLRYHVVLWAHFESL